MLILHVRSMPDKNFSENCKQYPKLSWGLSTDEKVLENFHHKVDRSFKQVSAIVEEDLYNLFVNLEIFNIFFENQAKIVENSIIVLN